MHCVTTRVLNAYGLTYIIRQFYFCQINPQQETHVKQKSEKVKSRATDYAVKEKNKRSYLGSNYNIIYLQKLTLTIQHLVNINYYCYNSTIGEQ